MCLSLWPLASVRPAFPKTSGLPATDSEPTLGLERVVCFPPLSTRRQQLPSKEDLGEAQGARAAHRQL